MADLDYSKLLRWFVTSLLLAAACVAAGGLGWSLAVNSPPATIVWPVAGVALAGLLICGFRTWPAIWFGCTLVEWWIADFQGAFTSPAMQAAHATAVGLIASMQALAAAWLIRRCVGTTNAIEGWRPMLAVLLFGGLLGTAPVAMGIGGPLAARMIDQPFALVWRADLLGVLLFTPLTLALARLRWEFPLERLGWTAIERLLILVAIPLTTRLFTGPAYGYIGPLLLLLVLLYSLVRFGKLGRAVGLLVACYLPIWNYIDGVGLAAQLRVDPAQQVLTIQNMEIVMALAMWCGSAMLYTHQQAMARALQSEQRLRGLINAVPDLIFQLDAQGTFRDVHASRIEDLLMPPDLILGKHFREVLPPDLADKFEVAIRHGRANGQVQKFDYEIALPNGAVRSYEARVVVTRDGEMLVVVHDITDRKQIQTALEEGRRLVERVAETSPDLVFVLDIAELRLVYINRQYQPLLGYTIDDIAEMGAEVLNRMIHPDDLQRVMTLLHRWATAADGEIIPAEFRLRHRDGTWRWFSGRASVFLRGDNGLVRQIGGIAQDITESRRVAEELARKQAELLHVSRLSTMGQMVATLSHEVAQPLSAVGNFAAACSKLLQDLQGVELQRVRQYVDSIVEQNHRAGTILKRLRNFSRQSAVQRSVGDLHEVVRDSVELLAIELRRDHVAVQLQLADAELPVRADRVQLQQVLVNLLANARDAVLDLPPGNRILTIATRRVDQMAELEVIDRGCGVGKEFADRLFDPFVTTKDHGMGMGLSICRTIVEEHHGQIATRSNHPHGAIFQVRLPLAAETTHRDDGLQQ